MAEHFAFHGQVLAGTLLYFSGLTMLFFRVPLVGILLIGHWVASRCEAAKGYGRAVAHDIAYATERRSAG